MAGQLTGLPHAGSILDSLNRRNLFTFKSARHNPVYQYHQLFREYLISRAWNTLSREELSDIRQNAASLLESAGRIEDALDLFRKAEDWHEVARLIREYAPEFHRQGRIEVIH